ncbi:hypothetical protein HAX54_044004 [Datura stramonium]|uniref:Uncharacterized protein n=1 Tax=Datura stramonium TaxID=4076 RepID=A0ABS8SPD5_DATST|nr:hypothetical protein [Datura stramonium]
MDTSAGDTVLEKNQTQQEIMEESSLVADLVEAMSELATLKLCDNKTKNPNNKSDQLIELQCLVKLALEGNFLDGDSTDEINELQEPMVKVESKARDVTCRLLEQLVMERAARLAAEQNAKSDQTKSEDKIHELREHLQRAERKADEFKGPFRITSQHVTLSLCLHSLSNVKGRTSCVTILRGAT